MAEITQNSHVRSESEHLASVNQGGTRSKIRVRGYKRRDLEVAKRRHSKRSVRRNSFRTELQTHSDEPNLNLPALELIMIGHTPRTVRLGNPVETTVVVTIVPPWLKQSSDIRAFDTSSLFAVATLVTENTSGEDTPLDPGYLMGQKLVDSVHPMPEPHCQTMAEVYHCRPLLGFSHFPDLIIRQIGSYRIRITVHQMNNPATDGATSLASVDSEPIRVECRYAMSKSW